MPTRFRDTLIVGARNSVEGKVVEVPSHQVIDEKIRIASDDADRSKDRALKTEITTAARLDDGDDHDKDDASDNVIIITGADAAAHLLPLRDDGEPALTFRSLFLATCLSAFQAVMSQIYSVSNIWASMILTSSVC